MQALHVCDSTYIYLSTMCMRVFLDKASNEGNNIKSCVMHKLTVHFLFLCLVPKIKPAVLGFYGLLHR